MGNLKQLFAQFVGEAPPPAPVAPTPAPVAVTPVTTPDPGPGFAEFDALFQQALNTSKKTGRKTTAPQGAVMWVGHLYCPACGQHTAKPKDSDFGSNKRTRSKRHCNGCDGTCEACAPAGPTQVGRNVSVHCTDPKCGAKFQTTRDTLKKGGVTYQEL